MRIDDSEAYPPYNALLGWTIVGIVAVGAVAYAGLQYHLSAGRVVGIALFATTIIVTWLSLWWRRAVEACGQLATPAKERQTKRTVYLVLIVVALVTMSFAILSTTHNTLVAAGAALLAGVPACILLERKFGAPVRNGSNRTTYLILTLWNATAVIAAPPLRHWTAWSTGEFVRLFGLASIMSALPLIAVGVLSPCGGRPPLRELPTFV